MSTQIQTSIEPETTKKVAKTYSSDDGGKNLKRMNAIDRHRFIDFLFDNYDDFDHTAARWNLAKEITTRYREETNQCLNVEWVACLLKYGICQYEDKNYGFEKDIKYTVDDLCRNPSLIRLIKL